MILSIRTGPCNWPILTDCCTATWDAATQDQRDLATAVATELLWRLSARRFGLCPITVRPCKRKCDQGVAGWPPPWGSSFVPVLTGGEWINTTCGGCQRGCSCEELEEVVLPGPVDSVTEVRVDGLVVPAAGYQVHDHRLLVRTDGGEWPSCQDLTAAPDEPGAFAVTYQQGIPVPPGGQYAAGIYACELIKSCTNDAACRLPRRVQTITRQNVSMAFLDPLDYLDKGLTGIPEVDQWITAVNPDKLRARSQVYSPDLLPPRVVTS